MASKRHSVLIAGSATDLAEYESVDNYAIDLFKGKHEPGPALTMVESYVVRAQKLATMSEHAFLASYGFRALPYLPGSPEDNVRLIYGLHLAVHPGHSIGAIKLNISSAKRLR